MMNILSLKFKNQRLEAQYQEYRIDNEIEQIIIYSGSSIFIIIPYLLVVLIEQRFVEFGTTTLIMALLVWCYYKIKHRVYNASKVIRIYEIFVLLIPVATLIVRFVSVMTISNVVQTSAIQIMLATVLPITWNIILAIIQYFWLIGGAMCILYQVLGFGMQIVILFWFSLFWLVLRYQQIKSNRQLFLQSLTNDSIYDILRSTTKEDLIVFTYDQINQKYDLVFEKINIDQQFDLLHFLTKFKLQNNISLCEYIWKCQTRPNNLNNQEISLTGHYGDHRIRYNLNLYIQSYPKQTFILKLYQPQDNLIIQECCKKEHQLINQFTKAAMKIFVFRNENRIKEEFWHLVLAYQTRLNLLRIYVGSGSLNIQTVALHKIIHRLSKIFQMNIRLEVEFTIISDGQLISVLVQQILLMIRRSNKDFTVYLLKLDEDNMKISFRFRNFISYDIGSQQKDQFYRLLNRLSLYKPVLERNQIDVDLIRNLGAPFL